MHFRIMQLNIRANKQTNKQTMKHTQSIDRGPIL